MGTNNQKGYIYIYIYIYGFTSSITFGAAPAPTHMPKIGSSSPPTPYF